MFRVMDTENVEQALLDQAKRQTDVIEDIRSAVLFLLALAILGVVIGLAVAFA